MAEMTDTQAMVCLILKLGLLPELSLRELQVFVVTLLIEDNDLESSTGRLGSGEKYDNKPKLAM